MTEVPIIGLAAPARGFAKPAGVSEAVHTYHPPLGTGEVSRAPAIAALCEFPLLEAADCGGPARWRGPWGELLCHRHAFPSLGDRPLDAGAAAERAELLHSGALLRMTFGGGL
jgi:hypothetical protein